MVNESDFSHISLSVIVPVFNEEEAIRIAIESNLNAVQKYLSVYEIIIVNDGSTDNSQSIINDFVSEKEFFTIVEQPENKGLGSAVRIGIDHAKYEYILPVPVDCPLDDATLHAFLSGVDGADILVGYRPERVGYSLRMKVNSYFFHFLISYLFKIRLKDYNWIHLYRRDIFTSGGIHITSNGIMMLSEILIKASRRGMRLKEIRIKQQARLTGTATASRFITVINTLREMVVLYTKL